MMKHSINVALSLLVATLAAGCTGGSSDSSGSSTEADLPNPYSNGYRVTRVTTTFIGEPWAIDSYIYDSENNTVTLQVDKDGVVSSKTQTLNGAGLIVKSVTPAADSLISSTDRTWEYVYNKNGHLISRNDLSGYPTIPYILDDDDKIINYDFITQLEYTYNSNAELESITDLLTSERHSISYNAAGQLSGGESLSDDGSVYTRFEILYDENGNISQVTDYNRNDSPIFSDTYEYEATEEKIVNHAIMRLLNELPDLTNTPF